MSIIETIEQDLGLASRPHQASPAENPSIAPVAVKTLETPHFGQLPESVQKAIEEVAGFMKTKDPAASTKGMAEEVVKGDKIFLAYEITDHIQDTVQSANSGPSSESSKDIRAAAVVLGGAEGGKAFDAALAAAGQYNNMIAGGPQNSSHDNMADLQNYDNLMVQAIKVKLEDVAAHDKPLTTPSQAQWAMARTRS